MKCILSVTEANFRVSIKDIRTEKGRGGNDDILKGKPNNWVMYPNSWLVTFVQRATELHLKETGCPIRTQVSWWENDKGNGSGAQSFGPWCQVKFLLVIDLANKALILVHHCLLCGSNNFVDHCRVERGILYILNQHRNRQDVRSYVEPVSLLDNQSLLKRERQTQAMLAKQTA